jgi:alpha-tubulin suppressor-like RCC1 family protein
VSKSAAIALATLFAACSDGVGPKPPPPPPPPTGLIASNPVSAGAVTFGSALGPSLSSPDSVVYVALTPGTVPAGSRATLRRLGSTTTLTTSILDGGFDPVPVGAKTGDAIEVVVTDAGGATVQRMQLTVAAMRPPIVVRTQPPPHKRDQPLNASLVMVFSEPVAGNTLTPSSVQLLRGTAAVPGTVHLLEGYVATAVFEPSGPLNPNTDYRLVVTQGVRDLTGDAVPAEVPVDFATGSTLTGPPDRVTVVPDTTAVLVGSQVQLTAVPHDSAGTIVAGVPITWSSDDPQVATVSSAGLVTTLAEGAAHIRAAVSTGGPSGVGVVLVTTSLAPVASVTLTPDSTTIPVGPLGGTVRLSAVLRDAAGNLLSFRQVQWSTSDPAIATVPGGSERRTLVTGLAPGKVTITATSEGKSGTATIMTLRPGPYLRLSPGGPDWYSNSYTCGVTVDAWVLCWGANAMGALGTATPGYSYAPIGVGGMNFSQVSATSARSCALAPGGAASCWGEDGALGLGGPAPEQCFFPCSQTPLPVVGGHKFTTIGLGGEHTCALTTTGTVYCWGYDGGGLLGIGPTVPEGSAVPVPVTGFTFTALAVGGTIGYYGEHTCGLTADGTAYCWGYNKFGQLGDSTTTDRSSPVRVVGGHAFAALSVGDGHTCGLTADGTAYCWGLNYQGQLGTGTNKGPDACWSPYSGSVDSVCSTYPEPVTGTTRWTAISAGGTHSCAVALDGLGYCWGDNSSGQRGDGTTVPTTAPTAVSGGLTFATLSAGTWHSCGVTTTGVAYCWGDNQSGQLGDGTTTPSLVPVKVLGQP